MQATIRTTIRTTMPTATMLTATMLTATMLTATLITLVAGLSGCGTRETPTERLERLRLNHELSPTGYTTIFDQGQPVGLIDLTLVNQGAEPLPRLTVLVTIVGEDGVEKLRERKTLKLDNLRPGVATQMAIRLPGVEIAGSDTVQVELEANLTPEELSVLPEMAAIRK